MMQLTPFRTRLADRLSGGMKQKLALACTLVHEPELIVLDEPTTGVDPVSRREFWKLLSQFLAAGITVLMSTPYLDEAERCARIALLHEGRLLALDEPGRLRASLPGTWLELIVTSPRDAIGKLPFRAQVFGDRLHLWLEETAAPAAIREVRDAAARHGVTLTGLRTIEPSLEDVFIAKLKGIDA
jgi:ABC-2 type transport system ATP-binding protein